MEQATSPIDWVRQWIGGPVHSVVMGVSVLVWAVAIPLAVPLRYEQRFRLLTTWGRFNLWTLRWLCGVRVQVREQPQGLHPPGVVFSKHQSTWETLALLTWFSPQTWVLKKELLYIPIFGWALRLLEPVAIDRKAGSQARQQVVDQGRDRLERGRWVVVFPEGTRTQPGVAGRYRTGGAQLAITAAVPLIPVAHNAGTHWPRRSPFKKPGTIQLFIGAPIPTEGRQAGELTEEAKAWIEGRLEAVEATSRETRKAD